MGRLLHVRRPTRHSTATLAGVRNVTQAASVFARLVVSKIWKAWKAAPTCLLAFIWVAWLSAVWASAVVVGAISTNTHFYSSQKSVRRTRRVSLRARPALHWHCPQMPVCGALYYRPAPTGIHVAAEHGGEEGRSAGDACSAPLTSTLELITVSRP